MFNRRLKMRNDNLTALKTYACIITVVRRKVRGGRQTYKQNQPNSEVHIEAQS
jgi:hypothetical protein